MNTIIYFTETYLGKFNTPEYVNLMDRFISQTQAQGEEVLHYQKADMDRMKELFGQLQNNVARSMALAETPELVALDSERTSLGQYIINSVRNAQSLPIKQKSDAAKQLYAVLRAYVGFYNQPAPQKTATLDGMLLDLSSEELTEYVTTLGLSECVEALTLKNAQYKVKVDARTQARSALHSTADSATLRTEMDALYKYITTVAFAHNVITPSEDITLYINNMNAVISEITASYNQRTAKRKKTENGEVKTENSTDPTQPPLDATLWEESEPESESTTTK